MKFNLRIYTYTENAAPEIERILRQAADKVRDNGFEHEGQCMNLYNDSNPDEPVGYYELVD